MKIEYRPIVSLDEMNACVALQETVWGFEPVDVVPVPLLVIARKYGGFLYGAFDQQQLIGFVYSLPGFGHTVRLQWSHMTAVHPRYQGRGIGFRLKQIQKEYARHHDFPLIAWTFDPLETRNAHFNFQKLGTIARFYEPNLYGVTTGKLHYGLPTDRLVAEWWVQWEKPAPPSPSEAPSLIDVRRYRGRPTPVRTRSPNAPAHFIPVPAPADYPRTASARRRMRKNWQDAVREAFVAAFAAGYIALAFFKDAASTQTPGYLLVHRDRMASPPPAW